MLNITAWSTFKKISQFASAHHYAHHKDIQRTGPELLLLSVVYVWHVTLTGAHQLPVCAGFGAFKVAFIAVILR